MTVILKGKTEYGQSFIIEIEKNLSELDLTDNELCFLNFEPLKGYSKLTKLDLSDNLFRKFNLVSIVNCTKIKEINLGSNWLSSIDLIPLENFYSLERFFLNDNLISVLDLNPLEKCHKLRNLEIQNNKIKSINLKPLMNCKNLENFVLDDKVDCLWDGVSIPVKESLPKGLQKYHSRLSVLLKISKKINCFYYLTAKENVKSILEHGILSRNEVISLGLDKEDLSWGGVQSLRDGKKIELSNKEEHSAHDLVPLYFAHNTPSNYRMCEQSRDVVLLCVSKRIIDYKECIYAFADGNVARKETNDYNILKDLENLDWDIIYAPHSDYSEDKDNFHENIRKKNSEFLVYPKVETQFFDKIIVPTEQIKSEIEPFLKKQKIALIPIVDKTIFSDIFPAFYS